MSDTVVFTTPSFRAASDEVTYSGQSDAQVQIFRIAHVTGAEGSKVVNEIVVAATPAVGAYGLTSRHPVVSTAHLITAGNTNPTSIKASPGTLKSVHVFNNSAAPLFVKFHDTAGAPTAGASVVLTVGVQASLARDFILPGGGRAFSTGIALTVVTGIADADATAVVADDASIEVTYE